MREELGFEPSMTTEEAFDEFARSLTPTGGRTERLLGVLADALPSTPALQRSTEALDG
jgi:UDP-glucose 4-epimerase